jgi:hypothetical protein
MSVQHSDVDWVPQAGGCDCGATRYRLEAPPLVVHCCHCRWCQRETGSAFALNAMIESDRVKMLAGEPALIETPSASGLGQQIARCPRCGIALWSHYGAAGPLIRFVRVGTLDDPDVLPPDVHIFTSSRQPWVIIPECVPALPAYYHRSEVWSAASLERYEALRDAIEAYRRQRRREGGD